MSVRALSARSIFVTATLAAAASAAAEQVAVKDFGSMFTQGVASFDFRYRYENVDEDGFRKEGKASTLRSRLTFTSADYHGFSFLTEFDDVTDVANSNYNSTANGKVAYPVVADPKGTVLNQAWVKYTAKELSGTVGRQRILQGNQRFVGGVAWRQNEQTYDGLRVEWMDDSGLKVDYAYIYNVNRIFGPDDGPVQPGDLGGDNNFLRVDWQLAQAHSVSGFVYNIEIDNDRNYPAGRSVGNSSNTFGLEYAGSVGALSVNATYASQTDAGDSPLSYDADYYFVEGAYTIAAVKVILGYELLGADNGVGFKTPYATLHKFQGWADKFLVTPDDGIEDRYVGLAGAWGPVQLAGYYHDFEGEDSAGSFGQELDLVATWPVTAALSLQLKYADFASDNSARFTDTTKAWLTINFKI